MTTTREIPNTGTATVFNGPATLAGITVRRTSVGVAKLTIWDGPAVTGIPLLSASIPTGGVNLQTRSLQWPSGVKVRTSVTVVVDDGEVQGAVVLGADVTAPVDQITTVYRVPAGSPTPSVRGGRCRLHGVLLANTGAPIAALVTVRDGIIGPIVAEASNAPDDTGLVLWPDPIDIKTELAVTVDAGAAGSSVYLYVS